MNDASRISGFAQPAWYCMRAATRREHLAATQLSSLLEVETFCPRIRFRRATRRGAVWFVEAMFPGYFMARFDARSQLRQVRYSPGVTGIVHFGDNVPPLPPAVVDGLRRQLDGEPWIVIDPQLKAGDAVDLLTGPFAGMRALVEKVLPGPERIRILFEFLGRPVSLDVDRIDIQPCKTG